jgi:hypothetical protein
LSPSTSSACQCRDKNSTGARLTLGDSARGLALSSALILGASGLVIDVLGLGGLVGGDKRFVAGHCRCMWCGECRLFVRTETAYSRGAYGSRLPSPGLSVLYISPRAPGCGYHLTYPACSQHGLGSTVTRTVLLAIGRCNWDRDASTLLAIRRSERFGSGNIGPDRSPITSRPDRNQLCWNRLSRIGSGCCFHPPGPRAGDAMPCSRFQHDSSHDDGEPPLSPTADVAVRIGCTGPNHQLMLRALSRL